MVDKMAGDEQELQRLTTETAKEIEENRGIDVADQLSIVNKRLDNKINFHDKWWAGD